MKKTAQRLAAAFLAALVIILCVPANAEAAQSKSDIALERVIAALHTRTENVDVSDLGLNKDTVVSLIRELYNLCPYTFAFNWLSYLYYQSNGSVTSLYIDFKMTREEIDEAFDVIERATDLVLSGLPEDASDVEKLMWVHDRFALWAQYDLNYTVIDAFNFFMQKKGVCEAYSRAYMAVCRRLGIPCAGVSSVEMNHIWNRVMLDGEWYHVDVTYDDPVADREGRVSHSYFILSDEAIKADGSHYGFAEGICTSDKYDGAFWHGTQYQTVLLNGSWYYAAANDTGTGIYRADMDALTGKEVISFDFVWKIGGGYFYPGSYSGIVTDGRSLYVNSDGEIIKIEPETLSTETVFVHDNSDSRQIYAIYRDSNGDIRYVLGSDPGASNDESFVWEPFIYGDANGDGLVDLADANFLKQYIANYDPETGLSSCTVSAGADADGNGSVDLADANLLKQYIANYDPETNTSTVILGAAA